MTYRGRVTGKGIVTLEDPASLPRGTEVSVRPLKSNGRRAPQGRPSRHPVMRHAGTAKGLPPDASRNLDFYLYGHPKQPKR